ncbi:MAG: hypothetical protein H7177_05825 [Rhizobacter sp.]|nr:hypothetical protein [Bacteriovorax sp.]
MLKSLILFTLMVNIAFAKDRFSDADKKRFLDDVKQSIAEHKVENKGRVDLQIIKPGLFSELEETVKQRKLTREEITKIKQDYEKFSTSGVNADKAEEAFYSFMNNELDDVNRKPLEKIKEGNVCNNWSCEDGLKCAPDPLQATSNIKGKKAGVECIENNECASQECAVEKAGSKKKICEDVLKCFRPLRLGEACVSNPVCGAGSCLPFNVRTSGIGECSASGLSCKKNADCCSNSCDGGTCKVNFICKDCVNQGSKPNRGQKCCEGLYLNEKGICAPDVPPSVIPEVYVSPVKKFFIAFVDFILPSAEAGIIADSQAQFDALVNANSDAPIGTNFQWGGGTLKVLPTGNMQYTPGNGGASVELTDKTNLVKLANASPETRKNIIETYGVDPLSLDKNQQATNARTIDTFTQLEKANTNGRDTSTSANIPGFGTVTYTYAHTEGSGDDAHTVPATITSAFGKVFDPATDFYASNEYAAMVGKKMTDADYKYLEDEKAAATKTAQSGATDGSAAAALEDEETFLNLGAVDDGLDLKSGVMVNRDHLVKKVDPIANIDMSRTKTSIGFNKKSDFETCDMRFRDDFYNGLKVPDKDTGVVAFDLEVAMLGFDFAVTGDSDSDYWRSGSVPEFPANSIAGISDAHDKFVADLAKQASGNSSNNSIFGRLKAIGLAHRAVRADKVAQIAAINKKLTCACLDVKGYKKITNDEKKKFFETSCDEYAKYTNPETSLDELNGDASGVKGKRLIVLFTQNLKDFYATLTVDNTAALLAMKKVQESVAATKFGEVETRNYDLFKFNIKNPSGSVAGLGAIVGALLAAGVIAIMGGFATTSILSAWAAAGIIAASAATGAGGLWMIATLKGAWMSGQPAINDYNIQPRTYSCGKKESCTEYTRTLVQPYNQICGAHTSANACIKSFIVVNQGKEAHYIVDPWIPVGVSKAAILKNQPNYVEKLEAGFQSAKNAMINKNPMAVGGGGKSGGSYVSETYLSEVFIDQNVLGKYLPAISDNMQETYFLNLDKVKIIKEAARKFAVSEGFIEEGDTDNLNKFADYAYEYHFVWPKTAQSNISYPTYQDTYLNFIAGDVAGKLAVTSAKITGRLATTLAAYEQDYQNTLGIYDRSLNQVDGLKKSLLSTEIDKTKQALASLANFNTLFDSKDLDSKLKSLNSGSGSGTSKLSGSGVNLSSSDANFLKAVSNLRNTRKDQLKSLDNYNKAMASNGDKERTAKMAAVSKNFGSTFSTGRSSNGSGGINTSTANSVGSSLAKDAAAGDTGKNGNGNGYNGNSFGSNNGMNGTGSLFGSGSGSSKSGSSKSDDANGGAGGNSGVSDADARKLAEAIDARNKANKDQYKSTDGQTLFEKVTNAYIRNYDKVLSKKKDKDVIEDKQ